MKQNKLLAVLLALLLCAMLPLSAMAATEYSFQLIPGDDMASVDAIKDLFDVLTVRFLKGEGSGMLTLSLSGEDVFSAATRMTACIWTAPFWATNPSMPPPRTSVRC